MRLYLFLISFLNISSSYALNSVGWPKNLNVKYGNSSITLDYHSDFKEAPVYHHPNLDNFGLLIGERILIKHSVEIDKIKEISSLSHFKVYNFLGEAWSVVFTDGVNHTFELLENLAHVDGIIDFEPDFLQVRLERKNNETPDIWKIYTHTPVRESLSVKRWFDRAGEGTVVAIIDKAFTLEDPFLRRTPIKLHYSVDELKARSDNPQQLKNLKKDGFHGNSGSALIWSTHEQYQGLAPKADAVLIAREYNWTSDIILSFFLAKMSGSDVISCPWTLMFVPASLQQVLTDLAKNGRQGRGTLVIVAAGNIPMQLDGGFMLANQSQVIAINAMHGENYGPVKGENILIALPVPYTVYNENQADYSAFYTGTSAASVAFTGVSAAILSAYPELTREQFINFVKRNNSKNLNVNELIKVIMESQKSRILNGF